MTSAMREKYPEARQSKKNNNATFQKIAYNIMIIKIIFIYMARENILFFLLAEKLVFTFFMSNLLQHPLK